MNRRGMIGMASALILAAFTGTSASLAETTKTKARVGCACCGETCACEICTCAPEARAGQACDCCGDGACCPVTSKKPQVETAAKANDSAKVNSACLGCCGTDCACDACSCDGQVKAGQACDCCDGAACCTTTHARAAKRNVEKTGKACHVIKGKKVATAAVR